MPRIFLLSLFSLLPLSYVASDCEPGGGFYGYSFLEPGILTYQEDLSPFFSRYAAIYGESLGLADESARAANLDEWYERFCGVATREDIEKLIYGRTLNTLERIQRLLQVEKSTAADLPAAIRANSFAAHLVEAKCREVVDYLVYAKQVEPYVTDVRADPFAPAANRGGEMKDLLDRALADFPTVESHYVRLRYAYQFLRLAHYLQAYDYFLELRGYLLPKIEADPSILYDWIESHYAGVLQARGEYAESAYRFSRVFDRCPSRREVAYESFRIRTDDEWRRAMLFCENDRQRATLHVLRAQNQRAVLHDEMEAIYRYDPDNLNLELLLYRELKELERDFLGLDFNPEKVANRRRANRPRPTALDRLVQLQKFVNRVAQNGDAAHPELWLLARGFLEMLSGDYFYAEESLNQVLRRAESDSVRLQAEILSEVTNVLALDRINDSVELYYYDLLEDETFRQRYPDFRALVNDKFEATYRAQGQIGKAALMQYGFDALRMNPQLATIIELERLTDSLNENDFDRELAAERIGADAEAKLTNLRGNYYLQRGQWEAALEIFRQIPTADIDEFGRFYPFVKQFRDRVDFRPDPNTYARYNKVELLEYLANLEDAARTTTNDTLATESYFQLGLAFYNMSYFGYAWEAADAFRSGTSARLAARRPTRDFVFEHPKAPLGNKENMSMDRAASYFERALRQAYDREIAAQIVYFLAKTERNEFYANGSPGGRRPFSYFRLLAEEYDDTELYRKAVEECRTFRWFVGG